MSLCLNERYIHILQNILAGTLSGQKVYVFGSRATGRAKKFSDIDLCIEGEELNLSQLAKLKDALSESDLPYFVDIVQKVRMSDNFYDLVKEDFIELEY